MSNVILRNRYVHILQEIVLHKPRSKRLLLMSQINLNFLIIKGTRCTNFSNLFWNETLHVSDSSSVHHQEFFTVHTAMVYVIQVCRVSFQNKFEKLVHLVPFIIRICQMHGHLNVK